MLTGSSAAVLISGDKPRPGSKYVPLDAVYDQPLRKLVESAS